MGRPFLLAQLSDPHIGAAWTDADPAARLAAAVEAVRSLPQEPDAVVVSGDLTEHATEAEYVRVRELLEPLRQPLYVLPGNHDERGALRRHFDVPGAADEPVHYAADLGPVRLIVLDTTRPGAADGAIDGPQLRWLDGELAAAPDQPTVIALHHPPLVTGVPAWDAFALAAADRGALAEVVGRHPQVRRLVGGHVHRTLTAELAGRPVVTAPSTYVQVRLNFAIREIELSDDPPGLMLHALLEGDLVTHVQPTATVPAAPPRPR